MATHGATRPAVAWIVSEGISLAGAIAVCLEKTGWETRVLPHPRLAVAFLRSSDPRPTLLVLDLGLPGAELQRLLTRLEAESPHTRILGLHDGSSHEAATVGSARYLEHLGWPFSASEFLAAVGRTMTPGAGATARAAHLPRV